MNARSRSQSRALSALASVAPSDVAAAAALWQSDPAALVRLRAAVVAALAGTPEGPEAAGVAVLSVARHYAVTGEEGHAVARAVTFGRQAVRAALSVEAPLSLDIEGPALEQALARPTMGADPAALVASDSPPAPEALAARVAEALAPLPDGVRQAWAAMGAAWLSHEAGPCLSCGAPRAKRPTLATVRAHAAGLPGQAGPGRLMIRQDRRTLALVAEALAPVLAGPEAPEAWGQCSLGYPVALGYGSDPWGLVRALRAAGLSGRALPASGRLVTVTPEGLRAPFTVRPVCQAPGALVTIPEARRESWQARAALAWVRGEEGRQARALARRQAEAPEAGALVESAPGEALADPWGRTVPTAGGAAWQGGRPGLPAWTGGPLAGAALAPGEAPEAGRLAPRVWRGEAEARQGLTVTGYARRAVTMVPTAGPAPAPEALALVTVTGADGVRRQRALSDREAEALTRTRETVTIGGEEVPVVRESYPGEEARESASTAPYGANMRRALRPGEAVTDAQVLSGARPVSPRKRAGSGATGPTVPDGGRLS